jgi:hypothetical protein
VHPHGIRSLKGIEHMPYVTSVERIGIRKGIAQGLQQELLLLVRLARRRFGAEVAERSGPLLERVAKAETLEDLAETLLDSPDGATWLDAVTQAAG